MITIGRCIVKNESPDFKAGSGNIPRPRLDKPAGFDYKDCNMPTEKSSPLNIPKPLKTFAWALIFSAGAYSSLFPATSIELKKEYDRWVRRSWTTENGLPQNTVYALAQASDGCLWVGSEGGLARFDGSAFITYRKSTTPGLASDSITALATEPDGSLWVGTSGGGLLKQRDGRFSRIYGLAGDRIWSLHRDRQGALWILPDEGSVYCLERGMRPARAVIDDLPDRQVTAVTGSMENILWIGTRGGLAAIRNGRETIFTHRDGLAGNYIYCLFTDSRGSLWVGTTTGLSRIDAKGVRSFSVADGLASNLVLAIGEDTKGRIWIGTDKGVTIMETGEMVLCANPDGLAGDTALAICRDREGGMWVGWAASGLSFLRRNEVRVYGPGDGLSGQQFRSIAEDTTGRLWAGTRDQGLNMLERGKWRSFSRRDGLASNAITALLPDPRGGLWIGTIDAGLQHLEQGRFSPASAGRSGATVLSLFIDRGGSLWVGSGGMGLDCLNNGHWRHYGLAGGLQAGMITALGEDRQGKLWAGSARAGLHVLSDGNWRRFTAADGLAGDSIYAIHSDGRGNIWLGTNGGLTLLRQGKFFNFREGPAELSETILHILEDDSGRLWMSTPSGIFCTAGSELERFAAAKGREVHCRLFGEMSGMQSTVCTGGFQPAGCKTRDGRLWFPTQKGLVMLDPKNLKSAPYLPPVWIEKIQANGRSIDSAGMKHFPPGTDRFDFFFTAISFADPQQIDFSTRLDGYEEGWSKPERVRSRHFSDLPSGSFTFRVRARGRDGIWNESGAGFFFTIRPYFHQTALFYLLLLAGSGAAAAGLFFIRQRTARRRKSEKYKLSTLSAEKTREYAQLLEKVMEKDKLYLDPELTLAKLAATAAIPAKHLSQIINEQYQLNFNDFINRYRVDEARRKLLDPAAKDFKLLRIAFESGFNSKSVFNSAFKKGTGFSPSEFRRLLGDAVTGGRS